MLGLPATPPVQGNEKTGVERAHLCSGGQTGQLFALLTRECADQPHHLLPLLLLPLLRGLLRLRCVTSHAIVKQVTFHSYNVIQATRRFALPLGH